MKTFLSLNLMYFGSKLCDPSCVKLCANINDIHVSMKICWKSIARNRSKAECFSSFASSFISSYFVC